MNLSYNAKFIELSTTMRFFESSKLSTLCLDLLKGKIVVLNGCYYFESLIPPLPSNKFDATDRTTNECFYNKVLIGGDSKNVRFNCGVYFAEEMSKKLLNEFGEGFNIIFSFDLNNSFVRFHKIRENEKWLRDDLEGYKLEAILTIVI